MIEVVCEECGKKFSYEESVMGRKRKFCDECKKNKKRALSQKWQENNPEKVKVAIKKWQNKNPEKLKKYVKTQQKKSSIKYDNIKLQFLKNWGFEIDDKGYNHQSIIYNKEKINIRRVHAIYFSDERLPVVSPSSCAIKERDTLADYLSIRSHSPKSVDDLSKELFNNFKDVVEIAFTPSDSIERLYFKPF